MDKKRLVILLIFLLVAAILGFVLYRVFFRKEAAAPAPGAGVGVPVAPPGELPTAGEGGIRPGEEAPGILPTARPGERPQARRAIPTLPKEQKIVSDPVIGASADRQGNLRLYNDVDGKFYRIGADGKPVPLSDEVFFNVERVTWAPKSSESIIEYPDGSNLYYNFDTKRQVTLPKHWESFSFAPQGDQIAAKSIGYAEENRWLIAANPDGNNVALVAALGDNADKVTVDWSPNNQIIALSRTGAPLGGDREEVLFVGRSGENFKSTIVEGRDLRSRWSPTGEKLLYSVYSAQSDFKPELWIVNAAGDAIGSGRRRLNLNTWGDKCAFADARTVFCGVPTELQTGVGFAPALADQTPDRLVKIDTQTGAQTEIPLESAHTIDTISVAIDGSTLYFTDKNTSGVFEIGL